MPDCRRLYLFLPVVLSLAATSPLVAITVSPATATLNEGASQQFSADQPSKWTTTCGSISGGGLLVAPLHPGSCSVMATATDGSASFAAASVQLVSPIVMTPSTAKTPQGMTQQFTANLPVKWIAKCGSINAAGLFTATSPAGTRCTVEAIASSGPAYTVYGGDTATTPPAFTVSPVSPSVFEGATQQFTASAVAAWATTCGSISSSGVFTAAFAPGNCVVTATSLSGQLAATAASVVSPISITPALAATRPGHTQQFTASAPINWSATCGAIDSNGLFTAPATAGNACQIVATVPSSPPYTANASVIVIPSDFTLSISPASANLHAIGTVAFTANAPVAWSADCGTIDGNGIYTAPPTAANCTVTAKSFDDDPSTAQAIVTTTVINYQRYKGDLGGTGAQHDELLLSPGTVNAQGFGQRWSAAVDGSVYAQPLYMNALMVNGTRRNVVIAATSNDSVYALDGDTGALLWQTSFLSPGVTSVPAVTLSSSDPTGILSTPVLDPDGGTLYVVAATAENNATYFPHRLHALDVATGAEKLGGPVLISNPALAPLYKFQRSGLLLANGTVYVAFGSSGDRPPYHGLVFGFDSLTLAPKGVFNSTPTGTEGGIWMSGAAPTADSSGNIYLSTGNGSFDGVNNFGESAVKLSPTLQPLDYFTPYDNAVLTKNDKDLGSGSIVIVPDQPGPFAHELVVCGKPSPVYLLNRDSMGKHGTGSDNVLQRLDHVVGATGVFRDSGEPCYNSPAVWNNNVYFAANHDVMKMFTISPTSGLLSVAPVSQGSFTYLWPGSEPVVSSNGDHNGIVWTIDRGSGTLHANDADNVGNALFTSPRLGQGIKWTVPTVANGFVYVGLQGKVVAYGLIGH